MFRVVNKSVKQRPRSLQPTMASSGRLDDAQFFAALSRRYADAAEEVAYLKTQIATLEREVKSRRIRSRAPY